MAQTAASGVYLDHILTIPAADTGAYMALLDSNGRSIRCLG